MNARDVGEQVRIIVEEAERAAASIRAEAEAAARRRSAEILAEAEADAAWIRTEAEARAQRYLQDTAAAIDAAARDRQERLGALADQLLQTGNGMRERFEWADTVRRQLGELATAMGETASRLAAESRAQLPQPQRLSEVRTPRPPTFNGPGPVIARPAAPSSPGGGRAEQLLQERGDA